MITYNLDKFTNGTIKLLFIFGYSGSGKSTLARKISCALNTKYHELDSIVWKKTITGDIKRTSADRDKLFKKIIERKD